MGNTRDPGVGNTHGPDWGILVTPGWGILVALNGECSWPSTLLNDFRNIYQLWLSPNIPRHRISISILSDKQQHYIIVRYYLLYYPHQYSYICFEYAIILFWLKRFILDLLPPEAVFFYAALKYEANLVSHNHTCL